MVEPKSRAGRRRVPIAAALRRVLTEHRANVEGDFVVGRDGARAPSTTRASSAEQFGYGDAPDWSPSGSTRLVIRSRAS